VFAIPAIANSKVLENSLARWQLPPIVFRNTVYLLAAGFFILMFTYADYWRLNDFSVLPNWAHKWYFKSLDPTSEKHTFISSVPFLLAFVSVLHAPHISIVYGAAVISCVADSVASVIGKSFDDHKMEKFGLFPNKSLEGLVAGAFSAYIGVFLVFHNCLPASTTTWDNMFALVGAIIFVIVDAYGKAIADNILNTLIPAFSFWFMYSIM